MSAGEPGAVEAPQTANDALASAMSKYYFQTGGGDFRSQAAMLRGFMFAAGWELRRVSAADDTRALPSVERIAEVMHATAHEYARPENIWPVEKCQCTYYAKQAYDAVMAALAAHPPVAQEER